MKITFKKREEPEDYAKPVMVSEDQYCPELYLNNLDGSDKVPEMGTATISYEIKRDSTTKADGKKSRDVTLEIHEINFKGGSKKDTAKMSTEDDVDKNLADAEEAAESADEEASESGEE